MRPLGSAGGRDGVSRGGGRRGSRSASVKEHVADAAAGGLEAALGGGRQRPRRWCRRGGDGPATKVVIVQTQALDAAIKVMTGIASLNLAVFQGRGCGLQGNGRSVLVMAVPASVPPAVAKVGRGDGRRTRL